MRLLLDTHVRLWWLGDDPLLPTAAHTAISDPDNEVVVSAAAVWEFALKRAAGRLEAPDDLSEAMAANDFQLLAITAPHALDAARLPAHHSTRSIGC